MPCRGVCCWSSVFDVVKMWWEIFARGTCHTRWSELPRGSHRHVHVDHLTLRARPGAAAAGRVQARGATGGVGRRAAATATRKVGVARVVRIAPGIELTRCTVAVVRVSPALNAGRHAAPWAGTEGRAGDELMAQLRRQMQQSDAAASSSDPAVSEADDTAEAALRKQMDTDLWIKAVDRMPLDTAMEVRRVPHPPRHEFSSFSGVRFTSGRRHHRSRLTARRRAHCCASALWRRAHSSLGFRCFLPLPQIVWRTRARVWASKNAHRWLTRGRRWAGLRQVELRRARAARLQRRAAVALAVVAAAAALLLTASQRWPSPSP